MNRFLCQVNHSYLTQFHGAPRKVQYLFINSYITIWPTYIVLLGKLTFPQLYKKFLAFLGTQVFLTKFTRACHLSLSWARLIHFMPFHPFSFKICFNICLPSVSRLPKWFSPTLIYAMCPVHLTFFDMITITIFGEEYKLCNS